MFDGLPSLSEKLRSQTCNVVPLPCYSNKQNKKLRTYYEQPPRHPDSASVRHTLCSAAVILSFTLREILKNDNARCRRRRPH